MAGPTTVWGPLSPTNPSNLPNAERMGDKSRLDNPVDLILPTGRTAGKEENPKVNCQRMSRAELCPAETQMQSISRCRVMRTSDKSARISGTLMGVMHSDIQVT